MRINGTVTGSPEAAAAVSPNAASAGRQISNAIERFAFRYLLSPASRAASSGRRLRAGISQTVYPAIEARRQVAIYIAAIFLTLLFVLASPLALAGPAHEKRVLLSRSPDKAAIENLQRWVSGGHDSWCKDARFVASGELRRIATEFAGDPNELQALPMEAELNTPNKAVFIWTPLGGRSTYRVTVERYTWLLSLAGKPDQIVWVPASTEVVTHP